MLAYVICGFLVGIGALFFVATYTTVQPGYGDQYNNEAIAGCNTYQKSADHISKHFPFLCVDTGKTDSLFVRSKAEDVTSWFGIFNGWMVSYMSVPPFIISMATAHGTL